MEADEGLQHGGGGTLCAEEDQHGGSTEKPTSCLLPARSLRSTTSAIPAAAAQAQTQGDGGEAEAPGGFRSLSFSKLLGSFRMARAPSSLSTLLAEDASASKSISSASSSASLDTNNKRKTTEELKQVCRSQSVPTSVRRFDNNAARGLMRGSLGGRLRVVPLPPPPPEATATVTAAGEDEGSESDIAAEEAVCRICMVALAEQAVLKLECSCKGELALAHRVCAIKWFSIKGNGACDVCGQEVRNLPVTLRRLHHHHQQHQAEDAAAHPHRPTAAAAGRFRVWHGTLILVIISMLAYFCFLEQLLVGDHGTAALAISLPFACVLGLFSSLTTTKMVSRRYVWIYSAVQFLFIVLFTHLFYKYVRMQAVIAIILSTFAGFSVAICTNSVLLQIIRWRATTTTSGAPLEDLEIANALPQQQH